MKNSSLMKVRCIAECSPWSILQYFDLHKAIIGLENQFLVFLRVAVLCMFTVCHFVVFYNKLAHYRNEILFLVFYRSVNSGESLTN